MTIEVIAAGLGRNATLSMKFALEALGFGPCHHMTEVLAEGRRQIPLWLEAAAGRPDWDAIFTGFRSTSDYPSASYWRELAAYYPEAKIVLATREPGDWCRSVHATIFADRARERWEAAGAVGQLMQATIFDHFEGDYRDSAFLADWYARRNDAVVEGIGRDRLLLFHPREGWAPLCAFLGVPQPAFAFPRVNMRPSTDGVAGTAVGSVLDPAQAEMLARLYINTMREAAFAAAG